MEQPEKKQKAIRIMLADDHLIVREGLVAVLSEEPDFELVSFAENGEQACQEYARLLPDALLLDLRMPERDGLVAAPKVVAEFQANIIVLTRRLGADLTIESQAGKGTTIRVVVPASARR